MTQRCGRITQTGTECTLGLLHGSAACYWHVSKEERLAYRQQRDRQRAAWLEYLSSTPACWRWSAPAPAAVSGEYDLVLQDWQQGRCAVCGGRDRRMVEDHDHTTGLVRGYLCRGCNVQEGVYQAPDTIFGRYRERHPTMILGLTVRYSGPFAEFDQTGPAEVFDEWDPVHNALIGIGL